jgi:hypothetical protein
MKDLKFFDKCIKLMKKHHPQLQEDGFHLLLPHASLYVEELIQVFEKETELGLKCWFLELLAATKSSMALPLFIENASLSDKKLVSLKDWAIHGLKNLDTKESRCILFKLGINK